MKQLLIDRISTISPSSIIKEGVGGGPFRMIGKLQAADTKNGNGRVYPKEILEREIEKYIQNCVRKNTSLGELDHPDSSIINLGNTSHIIRKVWWDGDDVMGEIELIPTPSGNIARALAEAGVPLGISSRGMGSVRQLGETVEVQDDFELLCWDLVSVPSTPGAYMKHRGLNESLNKIVNPYGKVNRVITEILCNLTGVCAICPDLK